MSKEELISLVYKKLKSNENRLKEMFSSPEKKIKFFYIDDLLPTEISNKISKAFNPKLNLFERSSLREKKRVGVKYDEYDPILKHFTYAIHSKKIIKLIEDITQMKHLEADDSMYAAGLSSMAKGNFLNPHLDNAHDLKRKKYRSLNLLYYCSQNWKVEYGGNLELWHNGPKNPQETLVSSQNRLIVMKTDKNSWHSVSKVVIDRPRNCISNYYFSEISPEEIDYNHVTSFRGRNDEFFRDIILRFDSGIRNFIRKFYKKQHTNHHLDK